jgi:hypothetical protein
VKGKGKTLQHILQGSATTEEQQTTWQWRSVHISTFPRKFVPGIPLTIIGQLSGTKHFD